MSTEPPLARAAAVRSAPTIDVAGPRLGWPSSLAALSRIQLLLLATLLTRALTFGNPVLGIDEEFYLATARAMTNGALPFVDVWDRKPIGLFLLYLPAAALPFGWGVLLYQLLACASVAGTAVLIARLADRAGWRAGATGAGLLYIVWLPFAGGEGGQAPVFHNLLTAAAAALVVLPARRRRAAAALAMLLVGLALQVKCSVVFEGLWFGLWAMWAEWRAGHRADHTLIYGAGLAATALFPTASALGFYASLGHADAFLFATFRSISLRAPDHLLKQAGHLAGIAVIFAAPVAMAFRAPRSERAEGGETRLFVRVWLAVAVLAVLPMGTWFSHYSLPILLPAGIAAAGFLARADRRTTGVILLVLAALGAQALLLSRRVKLGNRAELAALAQAVGHGEGCLHVYSGTPALYPATGRCSVTSHVFPSHLIKARESAATGVDQLAELRRVFATHPAVVVTRAPLATERRDVRRLADALLARDYLVAAVRPLGRDRYFVHVRRDGFTGEGAAVAHFR